MQIDAKQLKELAKNNQINESVVLREFVQLTFLKELYDEKFSNQVFFKGGTAIRLIMGGKRFSEDLDFTVEHKQSNFKSLLELFFAKLQKLHDLNFKQRDSLRGLSFLLHSPNLSDKHPVFIKLDFSFREKALEPSKSVIETNYPVVFHSFIRHLSAQELLAEKIRALMTRNKGRDLYDLWFLLSKKTEIKESLVAEKLKFYQAEQDFGLQKLLDRVEQFDKKQFVRDLSPFVPSSERVRLEDFFDYILTYLSNKLSDQQPSR